MIIGIDLGTSTSEAAYVDENGQVVVIPNSEGELITPSIVFMKRSGRALVGDEAKEYLFTRPECTFMEVKRIFGTEEKLTAYEKIYAPEEIQAHIIEYLVDCAEDYTGQDITGAVITVPAYFTDIQRKQTIRAGVLAGVPVERVINEPTAAAMDYGLQNLTECENILVYDFGGGTLDVTVLELFEGVLDVKSSCGNNRLGGKDFDELLMKHIAGPSYKTIMADLKAEMKLKQAATAAKNSLSETPSVDVHLPLIVADISISITITREEFEELIRPLVASTGEQIDTALEDAGLASADLQKVIFVGGITRIPCVRKFVEEKLGLDTRIEINESPELMVVRGAAVQAAIIEGTIAPGDSVVLTDVCPFTLGIKTVTSEGFKIDPLIRKNVTIPYTYNKVYSAMYEYQEAILFEIYQGESGYPQENTLIGQLKLNKLPKRQNELAKAEVTFSYDINGLLNVTSRALGNENTAATVIDINNNDLPVRPPVKLSEWKQAKGASKYRPLIRKAMKIVDNFIGSPFFMEMEMFAILDYCDELKAELILGNEQGAEAQAEEIRQFLDSWDDQDEHILEIMDFMDKYKE